MVIKRFTQMMIFLVGIAAVSTYFLIFLLILPRGQFDPSFILPITLVFGVIDLVAVLTLSAGILHHFKLSCKEEALGLPSGSIRALIALSLIVIFAMMAVFMGSQLTPTALTFQNGTYVTDNNGTVQFSQPTQGQKDFTLQTLTTVSTLVVAVAGFYFGTKAVEAAKGEKAGEVKIKTDPEYFADAKAGQALPITVTTEPDKQAVEWQVEGDSGGSLVHVGKDKYTYTPSSDSAVRKTDTVTVTFRAASDSSCQEKLRIKVA